jgi:hypothetical protein
MYFTKKSKEMLIYCLLSWFLKSEGRATISSRPAGKRASRPADWPFIRHSASGKNGKKKVEDSKE